MLNTGYARRTITPAPDGTVYLAGFGRNRVAQSVHDELYARALALDGGGKPVALVALDLIGLGRAHCLEAARRLAVIHKEARLVVACTHTHHGPDTIGFWGPDAETSGVDDEYVEGVLNCVVEVAAEALESMAPAGMYPAAVAVPQVVRNARDPKIIDAGLACARFERAGAAPVTLLAYPCHPEVLWDDNPHITADYAAALIRRVEAETGGDALFCVGAIGGMLTPQVPEHTFEQAEAMGETLAAAALNALAAAEAAPVGAVWHGRRELDAPLQNPLFSMAAARGLMADPSVGGVVRSEVSLTRVGPLWLAGVPGELLPKLGLALKEAMRAAGALYPAVVGLANDELGYILPQEDYCYPDDPFSPGAHYEETMSVGPLMGPRVMEALGELIEEA